MEHHKDFLSWTPPFHDQFLVHVRLFLDARFGKFANIKETSLRGTDDSSGVLPRKAEEVVVEGPPPPPEGPCIPNAEEANPPGPRDLVLGKEGLVGNDFQRVASLLVFSADRAFFRARRAVVALLIFSA